MAAIDFPASPVDGALFAANNGVMYRWMATPGIWVVQTNRAAAPGDFCASMAAGPAIPTTAATVVFTTVVSGNSGVWYNTTTGRFTPPAGRYALLCVLGFISSPANTCTMTLRKNGTNIDSAVVSNAAAGYSAQLVIALTVDANGTDYFDIILNAAVSGGTANGLSTFSAFPVTPPVAPVAAPTAPGDFWAYSASYSTTNVATTALLPVVTGNLSGYYSATTGRFTPPAGRYNIAANLNCSVAAASDVTLNLRKNGTLIAQGVDTQGTAAWFANPVIDIIVDANGADWFDIQIRSSGGTSNSVVSFSAFPLQPAIIPLQSAITADFCAQLPGYAGWSGFAQVGVTGGPMQVISGNTGNYLNLATGRFTPPAGRYNIQSLITFAGPGAGVSVSLQLLKNGTLVEISYAHTAAASQNNNCTLVGSFDANGTDYFELWINTNTSTNIHACYFTAFPINPNILSTTPQSMASTANFAVRATANTNFTGPGSTNIFRAAATPVEDYDVGACWDNANGEFIAPFAGRYQFNLAMHGDPASGGQYSGPAISHLTAANAVIRNYAAPHVINTSGANSANFLGQLLNMNAGEKVRFMLANPNAIAFTVHAEDATVIAGGSTLTYASGYRVT